MNGRQEEGLLAAHGVASRGSILERAHPCQDLGLNGGERAECGPGSDPPGCPGAAQTRGCSRVGASARGLRVRGLSYTWGWLTPSSKLRASPAALAGGPSRDLPLPLGSAHQCGPLSSGAPLCWPLLWLFHGPLACASGS